MPARAFEVDCPCCQATLKIDPGAKAVLSHKAVEKPPPISDLNAAVEKLKGAEQQREELFRKQVEAEKSHSKVLSAKFEELLKQAKAEPGGKPGLRDIDLD